jgi:serpin B
MLKAIRLPILAAVFVSACAVTQQTAPPEEVISNESRITTPSVSSEDAATLTRDNLVFAIDLYRALGADAKFSSKNLFFSPYSISSALAMTYAGARDETAAEMAKVMHYSLPQDRLHPAFNAVDLALTVPRAEAQDDGKTVKLRVSNGIFAARGLKFRAPFLDTLAQNYGAGVHLAPFAENPEGARQQINQWVSDKTESKIKDLLPKDSITQDTASVLANAVYFNAGWQQQFASAKAGTFHAGSGNQAAQMMEKSEVMPYAESLEWQATAIPYKEGLSMVLVVPSNLAQFESKLSGETVRSVIDSLGKSVGDTEVKIRMPKFKIEGASFSLKESLSALGMQAAFAPSGGFTAIVEGGKLIVSDVIHKAFVSVDEKGTEAAAATAVILGESSDRPVVPVKKATITADKPFFFVIRDDASGAVLFVGRTLSV